MNTGRALNTSPPTQSYEGERLSPGRATHPQWRSFPVAPESVSEARRFAEDVLAEVAGFDADHVDDVVLVVSELITNATREVAASNPRRSGESPVRLGIVVHPRWTHLYAVDTAPALPRETHKDPLASSGRGIPIIKSLAAVTWIEQAGQSKTIHVVVTRADAELTPEDRQALDPRTSQGPGEGSLLRPREVAALFGVRPTTIARWAREGRLAPLRTPGGHRRYRRADLPVPGDDGPNEEEEAVARDAVRLYEQGWNIRQVADRFGFGYGAMRRILGSRTTLRARGGRPPA
jgi:excisionase family DNA binding protein